MKTTPRALLPLFFIIFIDTVGYFVVLPVVIRLFIHNETGLLPTNTAMATRELLYSVTLMLSPLAFLLCSPFIGHLSDRFGRKIVLAWALIAACVGFLLPVIGIATKHISLILLGRLIAGASSNSQPVAQACVTDFSTGKTRARYLGLIGFAMTLGMVIGPLSGSYLSDHTLVHWFDTTTPYWFAVLLSVANIIMLHVGYQDPPNMTRLTQQNHQDKTPWWQLILQHHIWLILLAFAGMELAWSQYYQATFLFLPTQFHLSTNAVALFTAYVGLCMCLGLTVIYKVAIRYWKIHQITATSLFISAIGFVGCLIPNLTAQWIMMAPVTMAIGTSYPSLLAMISERTAPTHQGYLLGCASTVLGIAWMTTGLLTGPLFHRSTNLPILVSIICMALAAGISLMVNPQSIPTQHERVES